MMVNLKGVYTICIPLQTMFLNEKLCIHGENLITLQGESFFMNRWVNAEFEPIKYIVLGKSTARPLKTDTKLGQETVRKECSGKADINLGKLNLTATVSASEILDTTEIGVANDELLISHDIYQKISSTLLGDITSSITINYSFILVTGGIRGDWKPSGNAYYVYEPNNVAGVMELVSGSGYKQVASKNELVPGSYYYDINTRNVFIRAINDRDPRTNVIQVVVQTTSKNKKVGE